MVATSLVEPYLTAMFVLRLLRILTLVALLLAPLGMMSGHAAMAMGSAAEATNSMGPADHCGGMDKPARHQPASGIDCTIACSAVPSAEGTVATHPIAAAQIPPIALATSLFGLHPESDPPPPRLA